MATDEKLIDRRDRQMIEILKRLDRSFSASVTMYQSISNNQAIQNKLIIELIEDMKNYRASREALEAQGTTRKFDQLISQRFGLLWWFVDKIAPGIGLALILAVLRYLKLI